MEKEITFTKAWSLKCVLINFDVVNAIAKGIVMVNGLILLFEHGGYLSVSSELPLQIRH